MSVVGGDLRIEVAGTTESRCLVRLAEVRTLDRAVIVDAALVADDQRPVDGRAAQIEVAGERYQARSGTGPAAGPGQIKA